MRNNIVSYTISLLLISGPTFAQSFDDLSNDMQRLTQDMEKMFDLAAEDNQSAEMQGLALIKDGVITLNFGITETDIEGKRMLFESIGKDIVVRNIQIDRFDDSAYITGRGPVVLIKEGSSPSTRLHCAISEKETDAISSIRSIAIFGFKLTGVIENYDPNGGLVIGDCRLELEDGFAFAN